MSLPDEIVLKIFYSIPEKWKHEHQLKLINKQWKRVIEYYNLHFTNWIVDHGINSEEICNEKKIF